MRNRFTGSLLAAVMLAFSASLLAQTRTEPGSGGVKATPDLSGVWDPGIGTSPSPFAPSEAGARDIAAGRVPMFGFTREEPPLQPWAAEKYKAAREGRAPNQRGREEIDPIMYPYCMPHGLPRVYTTPFSFEIVQVPDRAYMLFESNLQLRRIYLDGRKHLEGWARTPMGISHGRWDGDTLVVETDNILSLNKQAWLDTFGHPFTDALHLTERMRRVGQDTLQIDFLFDDPGAYTKPWTGRKVFRLKDWDMTEYTTCEDHRQADFLRDMQSGKPAGRP